MSDHTQLLNYKGAYHDSDFNSDTINFYVDYNNMTGLTTSVANSIKSTITANNTKNGKLFATTIEFTYSNQTAPTSTVPMTSFTLSDMTLSREALCSGNLNLNSITGFTAYPSNANQYNYLTWTCSEDGYFAADGTVLCSPEEITSCRTLTLTGTAPAASGATSTVTGTNSQTIKLTITAPEIYNAYLTDRVVATGRRAGVVVSVNQYTPRVYVKCTKSGTDTVVYGTMSSTNYASGQSKAGLFYVPESVTSTAGTYSVYVYPADSQNNYATTSNNDVSGKSTYPYKYAGSLYVKDGVASSTDTLNITADTKVNRYGQCAIFAANSGTTSSSLAKPEGDAGISTYTSQRKYVGSGSIYPSLGAGFFGKDYTGYPSAETGEASFFYTLGDFSGIETKIATVAPEVRAVEIRNATSYKTDGYVEYLVKTNTDATMLKAYSLGTTDDISSDVNHITTTFNSTAGTYATYNATYSYKLWSVKVPITSSKAMQPVTLTAADPLGDGSVTKTPATGIKFGGSQYYYPGEKSYIIMGNNLTFYPADDNGLSLADCCKDITYSVNNTDYFSVYSQTTGRVNIDTAKLLTDLEDTTTSYKQCVVTAKLESGASTTSSIYAYRPTAKNLSYDEERSVIAAGGTVYYSVITYGSDAIYVRDVSDKYSTPLLTLTLDDSDAYTTDIDENGHEFITWHFERSFAPGVTSLKTYVRSSYEYSSSFTANSATYTTKTVTRNLDSGDYSAWNAQTTRITPALLSKLQTDYNVPNDTYTERLENYNTILNNAVMDYTETQQSLIDNQTLALKQAIDALVGMSEYENAVAQYETLMSSANAKYCTPYLEQLINTEATDNNYMELSKTIAEEIYNVNELAAAYTTVINYLARLETRVPELLTDEEAPAIYGASSYAALKAFYQTMRSKIDNTEYAVKANLLNDYAQLKYLADYLHYHNYAQSVIAPTCTEAGYTLHYCAGCGNSYQTDEIPATGHTPTAIATLEPTCTEPGHTGGTECSVCHAVLEEPAQTPALGHNWGVWTVTTPATHTSKGVEMRLCLRNTAHKETREIPMISTLPHTKLGDATDYTIDISVADSSAGKYAGLVDVKLKIAVDYTQLDTDDEKALTMFNQVIAFDPNVLSTVSKAFKTRGTPNMQAMWDAVDTSPYGFVSGTGDWALEAVAVPTYEGAIASDCVSYSLDGSALTYFAPTQEAFVLLNGLSSGGYINYDEIDRPEFTVVHLYLALNGDYSLTDVRNAVRLVSDEDLQTSEAPDVMEYASFVSNKAESTGAVNRLDLQFSDDFYEKYDITFKWFTDGGEEQTTVVPTIEGRIPQDFTPDDYMVGDIQYSFTSWDRELAPATGATTYTAQYGSTDLGHDFVVISRQEPRCTAQGNIRYRCSRCSYQYTEYIDELGHDPITLPAVEPTCTEQGCTDGVGCSRCKAILVNQIPIPALGHSWIEWEITKNATCLEDGELVRYCSRDTSHQKVEVIPATGHTYEPTITAPTCTQQGYTTYTCSACRDTYIADYTEPLGHTPQVLEAVAPTCTETGLTEGSKCSVCKEILTEQQVVAALGHDYGEWTTTTPATCTEKGLETKVCSRDASHTLTREIAALGHSPQVLEAVAASCTESGLTEGSKCSVCKEILTAQQVVPALGHDYGNWAVTTPATCTEKGVETRFCARDTSHKETREIAALGHSPQVVEAVAPTCTETGLTEGSKCSVCKEILTAQQVVAALGHDYGEWSVTTPATCTEKGVKTRVCTRDANHTETEEIAMIAHSYSLHDQSPLDKTNGYAYYSCDVCGHFFLANYAGNKLVPGDEVESIEDAKQNSPLPAPFFNIFVSADHYDYATRGASLRISESAAYDKDFNTTQGMRFTASVKVPEGVDFKVGSAGNVITDFGFVYSQPAKIDSDMDNLVKDGENVYSMSVPSKNTGVFDGTNWQGVTYHEEDNTLTFNLVINVKAMNWERDYCARAYITYNFNGYQFTIYDDGYSEKAVSVIAQAVVQNPSEAPEAIDFCKHKILDHI